MSDVGLPPVIELAWGRRDRPAKGPKPGLTLDRIVSAGVKLALTDGLAAVSMSRVAAELGASTMSLYRYVSAKDELLMLMVDQALGPPPAVGSGSARSGVPGAVEGGWREGLARWATALRAAYRRHPWALRVPISAPPLAPNNVAWLENALRSLDPTPLSEQQKLSTVLLVSGFVRNEATLTADFSASVSAAGGQPMMPRYGAALRQLVDSEHFPALVRAIASGALDDDDDPDIEFDFGLERILDGVEMLIQSIVA